MAKQQRLRQWGGVEYVVEQAGYVYEGPTGNMLVTGFTYSAQTGGTQTGGTGISNFTFDHSYVSTFITNSYWNPQYLSVKLNDGTTTYSMQPKDITGGTAYNVNLPVPYTVSYTSTSVTPTILQYNMSAMTFEVMYSGVGAGTTNQWYSFYNSIYFLLTVKLSNGGTILSVNTYTDGSMGTGTYLSWNVTKSIYSASSSGATIQIKVILTNVSSGIPANVWPLSVSLTSTGS